MHLSVAHHTCRAGLLAKEASPAKKQGKRNELLKSHACTGNVIHIYRDFYMIICTVGKFATTLQGFLQGICTVKKFAQQ